MSTLYFLLELMHRAWNEFVSAVGTTTLGFLVGLAVLPILLHLLKVWRGKTSMKFDDFLDTGITVLAVYGTIYLAILFFGVPRRIRQDADSISSPTYRSPSLPFNWDTKTPVRQMAPQIKVLWTTRDEIREGKAVTWVSLKVDQTLDVPAFMATCDRPCKTLGASVEGYSSSTDLEAPGKPDEAGMVLQLPRPLGPGVVVNWPIQAIEGVSPLNILRIRRVLESDLPSNLK